MNQMTRTLVKQADMSDLPGLEKLLKERARECGDLAAYDAEYARNHLTNLLMNGTSFIAYVGEEPAGAVMCSRTDQAYKPSNDLQTEHFFVALKWRGSEVGEKLLLAADTHSERHNIFLFVNYLDWEESKKGEPRALPAMQRLYRRRTYDFVGITYIRRPKKKPDDSGSK